VPGNIKDCDTIAAVATPAGPGGIGIVRASGPLVMPICRAVFQPAHPLKEPESFRLHYGWAVDPRNGTVLDEVLCAVMRAPRSYTREDVLELHCHSGPAVLRRILDAVLGQGARIAEPGEFTRRAFLNGRIDLTQAEAVLELTRAQSECERAEAVNQLEGRLKEVLKTVRAALLEALARVEVAIDFPEEDIEFLEPSALAADLSERALTPLQALLRAHAERRILREGARLVLVGRPNVGKSSLFNALLGTGRVIVSPVPGTTRDIVEESIELQGLRLILADTAGIRTGPLDPVEDMGITMAMGEMRRADHIVAIFDLNAPPEDEDVSFLRSAPPAKPVTIVLNKRDLCPDWIRRAGEFTRRLTSLPAGGDAGGLSAPPQVVPVSALTGEGLHELKSAIVAGLLAPAMREAPPQAFVPNLRQKQVVEGAVAALGRVLTALEIQDPPELIALDLKKCLDEIETVMGTRHTEDLLDMIFGNFCIGK